ncbi:ATP-dependent nuclease [Streptomyces sennicomposti]|uniref:ATP-dependent nuclease n=1 Tax=Streptomyces sennicomposti TaxID=2873384 RepID=UPI001CA623AA|nr:AAA family ATPase [Streptomyces sennicomposti]MBY8868139.1 AAA family ATPase [Streptomyces sennicomposti]
MRLTHAEVINFRALDKANVRIDLETTLIVGRNNSGKTSFVNLFEKFLGEDDSRFTLEDFSTRRIADIEQALRIFGEAQAYTSESDQETRDGLVAKAYELVPSIRLGLTIEYDEDDDLAPLTDVILDLDDACFTVKIEAALEAPRPHDFLKDFWTASKRQTFDPMKWLRKNFSDYFTSVYRAISPVDETVTREIKRSAAQAIVSVKFVYAQTKVDDTPGDKARTLSKTFETYYKIKSGPEGRHQSVEHIEDALAAASMELDTGYEALFDPVFEDLRSFGVGTITPVEKPRIVSLMEATGILKGSTRLQYPSGEGDFHLPEGHNGLGYSKLIFTILQIISFHQAYERATPKPAVQVLFIEEPEAHLHPQMQEVFIRNIQDFIRRKAPWDVQVVITTHSSHIVASGGFHTVRYFDRSKPDGKVKDLSTFEAAVKKTVKGDETLRFLRQYMVLHRCDMFFADKVILIEGAAERLLLPEMVRRCAPDLLHQYVSVIEVGDAYAIRFRELLEFLSVKTLVITDIDSVSPEDQKACMPRTEQAITSNSTLKNWLPGQTSIAKLLAVDPAGKEHSHVRVAYQIPEKESGVCARSFEDAFIIANAAVLARNLRHLTLKRAFVQVVGADPAAAEVEANAFAIAKRLSKHKTDFAFDVMLLDGWTVPHYIAEGLQWLA